MTTMKQLLLTTVLFLFAAGMHAQTRLNSGFPPGADLASVDLKSEKLYTRYEIGENEEWPAQSKIAHPGLLSGETPAVRSTNGDGERTGFVGATLGLAMPIGHIRSRFEAGAGFNYNLRFGYLIHPNFGISGSWSGAHIPDEYGSTSYGSLSVGALATVAANERINFDFKAEVGYFGATETEDTNNGEEKRKGSAACFVLGAGLRYSLTESIALMGNLDLVRGGEIDDFGYSVGSVNLSCGVAYKMGGGR